jgi:hypothetical protein
MARLSDISLDEITITYPNKILIVTNILGGMIAALIAVVSLFYVYGILGIFSMIYDAFWRFGFSFPAYEFIISNLGVRRGSPPQDFLKALIVIVTIIIFGFYYIRFSIAAYKFGLAKLGAGLLQWRNSGVPHGVPERFHAPLDVMTKLIKKEKYSSDIKPGDITALFGLNAQHMSPTAAAATQRTFGPARTRWMKGVLRDVVTMAMFVGGIIWIHMQSPSNQPPLGALAQLFQSAGLWPSLARVLFPMSLGAIALIVFAAMDYAYVSLMVPKKSWRAESETRVDRAVASLPPNLIHHEFPARMGSHGDGEKSRFLYPLAAEVAATSVGQTGNFALVGLLEQDAVAIANPDEPAAKFRLLTGWLLILAGLLVGLFGLWPSGAAAAFVTRTLPAADVVVTPVVQIALAVFAARLLARGRAHLAEAETALEAHWFKSEALAFQMQGTTSKSEIKIGGATDSIGTTSIVYRSEFLYDLTAATVVAEAASLGAERRLVGFEKTPASTDLLGAALAEIRAIVSTRAAPITVDIAHGGLQDQIDANLRVDAHRAGVIEAARLEAQRAATAQLGATPPPPRLSRGDET